MAHDQLAQRRQTSSPEQAQYKAYEAADEVPYHLWLRGKSDQCDDAPSYSDVTNVTTDRRTIIVIGFTTMVVELRGRNLSELYERLLERRVRWIQAFDPKKGREPSNPASPVVNLIAVHFSKASTPSPEA